MERALLRNFIFFCLITIISFAALLTFLNQRNNDISNMRNWITHTYKVIDLTDDLSTLVEGMVGAQRAYIITDERSFFIEYQNKKNKMSRTIASLSERIHDNPSQSARMAELQEYYTQLNISLEERAQKTKNNDQLFIDGVALVDGLRKNILRLHSDIIHEEQNLLSQRIKKADLLSKEYKKVLYISGASYVFLMILLNGFLISSQKKWLLVKKNLKDMESRFILAAEGASDGIFDWDLLTDQKFCSRAYFKIMGIDKPAQFIHIDEIKALIHPDDLQNCLDLIDAYLKGERPEYALTYRIKHTSGRWIWVKSRGKAIYDSDGKPCRIVGANSDITALKAWQERLETAKLEAENASRAKSDFLAHMSHEIRTPLTAICGVTEILQKQKLSFNEKQQNLINVLTSSSDALRSLIDDVLDYSKIESGAIVIEQAEYDTHTLFSQVSSIVSQLAIAKNLNFSFTYDDQIKKIIIGDEARVRQILLNLLGNAIKFTQKGSVEARAEFFQNTNGDEFMQINVIDTGIGINEDTQKLIFEKFKQGDDSIARKFGGSGLGLSISRDLARLMGGDLTLESILGEGSIFTFTLPTNLQKKNETALTENNNYQIEQTHHNGKILIVDDTDGNVAIVTYYLEEHGFEFERLYNGLEAVEKIKSTKYGLIIMDVQMPIMDGITATQNIREHEKTNEINPTPIIGMSAHALIEDRNKCLKSGMDAYLTKPIDEKELISVIKKFMPVK